MQTYLAHSGNGTSKSPLKAWRIQALVPAHAHDICSELELTFDGLLVVETKGV